MAEGRSSLELGNTACLWDFMHGNKHDIIQGELYALGRNKKLVSEKLWEDLISLLRGLFGGILGQILASNGVVQFHHNSCCCT